MSDDSEKIVLVYDTDIKAPACVLIQAAKGGTSQALHRYFLDSRCWLIAPTPGMRLIAGTDEEWRKAAEITQRTWKGKDPNRGDRGNGKQTDTRS